MDLLGMNAVAKTVKGQKKLTLDDKLKTTSLAGDMISNSLYFGMANMGDKKCTLIRGALLGLSAGVGAVH